jgi:hypothetical protein
VRIKVKTSAENALFTLETFVLKEDSILDQLVFHVPAEDLIYRAVFMTTFIVLVI